jgi:protein O-GlcNAc transferase
MIELLYIMISRHILTLCVVKPGITWASFTKIWTIWYTKAILCYQTALSINPKFSQALNNIGVVYTVQGKMSEAYGSIRAAINENPSYGEAYNNLGVLCRDEGNIKEAIKCYEKCLQLNPTSRNASQNRLLAMNCIIQ